MIYIKIEGAKRYFSINYFPIEMYGFMSLCVSIDTVHDLTKMCLRGRGVYMWLHHCIEK